MKKVVIIGLIFIANILSFLSFYDFKFKPFVIADENKKYAQIQKENVPFFLSSNGTICFELPKSYYVELLANVDNNGYYKAKYLEQVGYVKKDDIQCVASAPNQPFLKNINFRILANQSAELRSEPSREKGASTLICELELYETNFIYYGNLIGEEVVSKRGNVWYYCAYVKNGIKNFGYVYAGLVDQMQTFDELEINAYPIDTHKWIEQNHNANIEENFVLDAPDSSQFAIIIAISIPALILIIALFRPIKIKKGIKNKTNKNFLSKSDKVEKCNVIPLPKQKKQPRASKGKDFYELK